MRLFLFLMIFALSMKMQTTCKSCYPSSYYLPLLGISYAVLLYFLTPSLAKVRWFGSLFALALAAVLTYISLQLCWYCLAAHSAHLLYWITLPTSVKRLSASKLS